MRCFIGIDLERREGGYYEGFRSNDAEKKEIKGDTLVSDVLPGHYTLGIRAYGDCKWTVSIEPD